MTVAELHSCRPAHDRQTCLEPRCAYADPDGSLARAGREKLRDHLTSPTETLCGCARCQARNRPLGDIEAGLALRHVTDRQAVLYQLDAVAPGGMIDCDRCRAWIPSFHAAATLSDGRCPFHG